MSHFIVFEGIDGSGKSTLLTALSKELVRQGLDPVITREPGGTNLGDQLRHLILQKTEEVPTPRAELLMYEASRAQHVEKIINPALAQKKWVLCDRFSASSVAFQAGGRQILASDVVWLNNFATNNLTPDLTVLVDVPVEEAQRRRLQRQSKKQGLVEDRIESEKSIFHQKVRDAFLDQAKQDTSHWLVLNGLEHPDILFEKLLQVLKEKKWLSK